jgi:D-glycero-D-manno-heptose 1,7-bisphosphate phosphatase
MSSGQYVLLDRDGVINNDSDDYIKSAAEWHPLPRSLQAIALLNKHGLKVAVITNQSGIGRGLYDVHTLQAMHAKMIKLCHAEGGKIDLILYCPHRPEDACDCRKPKPGLIRQFAEQTGQLPDQTYFVGDKMSDIQAAENAGVQPILVKTGKGQQTLTQHPDFIYPVFEDLYDAAKFIITSYSV